MSLYNGPPRPGARGGRDQFSWDNVKADKDREYYLGHSVKALAGRWQKGRDVYWYTREKSAHDAIHDEVQAVKQREEELMMEALGLKPKTVVKPAQQLDKHDLDALIKGKQDEEEQPDGVGAAALEADRVKGLGYIAGTGAGPSEAVHTTLPGVGAAGGGPHEQQCRAPPPFSASAGASAPAAGGRTGAALALASGMTADELKQLRRAEKRAKKAARKVAKQAKKEAKRAKKEAKKARREGEDAKYQKDGGVWPERKSRRHRSASGSTSSSSDGSSSDSEDGRRGRGGASCSGVVRHSLRAEHPDAHGGGTQQHGKSTLPMQVTSALHRPRVGRVVVPSDIRGVPHVDRQAWRDRECERGGTRDPRAGSGSGHDRVDWQEWRSTSGGPDDGAGRQPRPTRARHDSPSPSPRQRRSASPGARGKQQHRRHDTPSPGRGRRRSRSRSREPSGRRDLVVNGAGLRAGPRGPGPQGPCGDGARGGYWRTAGDRSRSRSRSPARRRRPVPRRRERRSSSRSPVGRREVPSGDSGWGGDGGLKGARMGRSEGARY